MVPGGDITTQPRGWLLVTSAHAAQGNIACYSGKQGKWGLLGEKNPKTTKKPHPKPKHHQKNPTRDDSAWRRARYYHLSRNNYSHKCRRRLLLAALAIPWAVGGTRLTLYQQCHFRGKGKVPLWRGRAEALSDWLPKDPHFRKTLQITQNQEVSKAQAMEENGTRWSSGGHGVRTWRVFKNMKCAAKTSETICFFVQGK